MKRRLYLGFGLALASALSVFACSEILPVWAGDNAGVTASFIDKDFEMALRKHFQKRFFNLIDANETQRREISAVLEERMDATRPQREKLRAEAVELSEMMASEASDQQIVSKVHEVRDLRNKLMDERLTTALKVRSFLQPEQRKTISARLVSFLSGNARPRLLNNL